MEKIKSVIHNDKNFDDLPTEIKLSNRLEKDPKNTANIFNNYFVKIGHNVASKISSPVQHRT